jgi:hypothetical protein
MFSAVSSTKPVGVARSGTTWQSTPPLLELLPEPPSMIAPLLEPELLLVDPPLPKPELLLLDPLVPPKPELLVLDPLVLPKPELLVLDPLVPTPLLPLVLPAPPSVESDAILPPQAVRKTPAASAVRRTNEVPHLRMFIGCLTFAEPAARSPASEPLCGRA